MNPPDHRPHQHRRALRRLRDEELRARRRSRWCADRACRCGTTPAGSISISPRASRSARSGHCHPVWVEAVRRQAGELIHVSNLFRNPNQGELARRLVQQAGPGRVFFCNSGAEANEGLIKLARLHGVRKSRRGGEVLQDHLREEGLPRPHVRRHERHAAGEDPEGLSPAGAGLRLRRAEQSAELRRRWSTTRRRRSSSRRSRARAASRPARRNFCWGLRELCDQHNLLLHARRGAVRRRPHGHVLRLRARRRPARRHRHGQGPGRRLSRSARSGRRRSTRSCSRPAPTARPLAARRWPARRRWPCSTCIERGQPAREGRATNGAAWKAGAGETGDGISRAGARRHAAAATWSACVLHGDPAPYLAALREAGLLAPSARRQQSSACCRR